MQKGILVYEMLGQVDYLDALFDVGALPELTDIVKNVTCIIVNEATHGKEVSYNGPRKMGRRKYRSSGRSFHD